MALCPRWRGLRLHSRLTMIIKFLSKTHATGAEIGQSPATAAPGWREISVLTHFFRARQFHFF
jgi:hypothetical protein